MGNKFTDVLPAPTPVKIGNGSIDFHGISAEQISILLGTYKDDVMLFISGLGNGGADWGNLVLTMPDMCHRIVAMATDNDHDEEQLKAISRLPLGDLASALGAVYKLSVPDPKKFWGGIKEAIARMQEANRVAQASLLATSSSTGLPSGSTTSAEPATASEKSEE